MIASLQHPRRLAALVVALAVAGASTPARAQEVGPGDIEREVEALAEQEKYREMAERIDAALTQLPEAFNTRVRRNLLVSKAINGYRLAFEQAPGDCELADAGVSMADEYLRALLSVYGAEAERSDEYVGISRLRRGLEATGSERGCSTPVPPPQEEVVPPPPTVEPEPAPASPPSDRPLVAGIAVTAGLAGAMLAVSLGTGLSRYKEPYQGAAFKKILHAAEGSYTDAVPGNEVNYGVDTDMCAAASGPEGVINQEVYDACAQWDRLGKAAIATGVIAGVLGVTAIALSAVLVRNKRRAPDVAASLRRHQAFLGAAPGLRGGMNMSMGFRF